MDAVGRLLETRFNAGKRQSMRVVGGEGVRFELDDGRRVIDGSNTGGPLGHRHPDLVAAVRRAADSPVVNDGWLWAEREEAARDLIDIAFKGEESWIGAVRFFLSGSEANDLALTLSQAITGRSAIATRERRRSFTWSLRPVTSLLISLSTPVSSLAVAAVSAGSVVFVFMCFCVLFFFFCNRRSLFGA